MNKKDVIRVFFDTETYTNYNGILMPYLIGWCTDKNPEVFKYSLEPHDEFFKVLEEFSDKYEVQLWAHNVQYDLYAIYPTYLAKLPHKNPSRTGKTTENGQLLAFNYRGIKGNKIKFQAFCTFRGNRGSLASWANDMRLKVNKGAIDYEKYNFVECEGDYLVYMSAPQDGKKNKSLLSDELEYLKNDVYILNRVGERITTQKKEILGLGNYEKEKRDPATIPAFGELLLNRLMGGNDRVNNYAMTYKANVEKQEGIYMENSRMGGFTAYNRDIAYYDSNSNKGLMIKTYDVNSMYPAIMRKGLPAGPFVEESSTTLTGYLCVMKKIKGKEEYSFFSREPVPAKFKKSPVYLCEMYLNLLKKYTDNDIEVISIHYQEHSKREEMVELIDVMFKIKSDSTKPDYVRDGCKKTMNSQYGKFMQRNYHLDYYYDIDAGGILEYHPENPRPYKSNLTGIYIVQVAQSLIIDKSIEEHERGNTFVYCDTDSLKIIETIPPLFEIGEGLGQGKHEGDYHLYMNNGKAKKYFLGNYDYPIEKQQIKMSGIENTTKAGIKSHFSLADYKVLFNRANNVLLINGKTVIKKSELGQPLICRTDIEFNKGIEYTHLLDITKKGTYLGRRKN